MTELTETSIPENRQSKFSIKHENGAVEISSPYVDLDSEKEPLKFAVTVEKIPTEILSGVKIEGIEIDRASPKLNKMLEAAASLKDISDREKPRKILELLRSNVHFAYDDVIEELSKTNPDLAKWVAENTGISSPSAKKLKLSEVIDSGYGICRHLSVAMLVLANEAGMEGAFLTNGPDFSGNPGPVKNIIRKDNGQPLFKIGNIGDFIGGHAWVELTTSDGEWIPVDPSAQLVGDTKEGMETFREANYRASVGRTLEISGFPTLVGIMSTRDLEPFAGEARHTGILEVNSIPKPKPIKITFTQVNEGEDKKEQWPKPTKYQGPFNFSVSSSATTDGLTVAVIEAKTV